MKPQTLVVALLLALPLAAQTPPCAAENDANNVIDTNSFTGFAFAGPGHYAYQYTPTTLLVAQAMTVVTNQYSGSTTPGFMSVEVWSDNGGMPGTRIAGGTWRTDFGPSTPYWQGANFDQLAIMQMGTPYWLVWIEPGGSYLPVEPNGVVTLPAMHRTGNNAWATRNPAAFKFRLHCNPLDDVNVTTQGSGCFNSTTTLGTLFTTRAPTLGNARFLIEGGGFPPNSLALVVLGVDPLYPGMPVPGLPLGCQQNTDALSSTVAGTTGAGNVRAAAAFGHVTHAMPVPANPTLLGMFVAAQMAVLDAGNSAPIPFVTSNALRLILN